MEINRFKTDPKLEAEGVWIELGEGASILVARSGNRKHSELLGKLTGDPAYKRKEKLGTLTDEDYEPILIRTLAETILLDWKGLTEDGKPVPYSLAKAKEFLAFYDFRKQVMDASTDAGNYRGASIAGASEALKKS